MTGLLIALAAATAAQGHEIDYEATITAADGAVRALSLKLQTKGDRSLWTFTAPDDVKGTRLLVTPEGFYVYLPAFGKVRRIKTEAAGQPFMGLAFSAADLAARPAGPGWDRSMTRDGVKTDLKAKAVAERDFPDGLFDKKALGASP